MGRLAGFRYREIVKRLKRLRFEFDRQAAGSHEIWYNPYTGRYTTIPNHAGDMPEGTRSGLFSSKLVLRWISFWIKISASASKTRLLAK